MGLPVVAHAPSNSLVLYHEDPFSVRELIPQSKTIVHSKFNLTVKWSQESVDLLRSLGFDAPAPPAQIRWPGKFQPKPHQIAMIKFLLKHERCFNLSEMGSMKTAPCLWASDRLMKAGKIKKVLIFCPLSTVERVWLQEVFDTVMHRHAVVVHGSKAQREKALASDADYYIVNHDATKITWLRRALYRRKDINLVVVDEGSMFRNGQTEKFKKLKLMLRPDQRVWWLTGTPTPNEPTDAWAQCQIICPQNVPPYFGQWRRELMEQAGPTSWVPRPGAEDMVFKAMQPAIRFLKKDVQAHLPPVTTISLSAALSAEQQTAYDTMRAEMVMDIGSTTITAVNAADRINKLRQCLCGVVRDKDTGTYLRVNHGPRLSTLKTAIDMATAKVLVVVPFKGIIQSLSEHIIAWDKPNASKKNYTVEILNGDVSPGRRDKIIRDFKQNEHPRILLCHPKVMAHGLNLTEADVLIFYAPIYSNDEFEQVSERFNRMGQTRKMTIVRIGAHALEWKIYGVVDSRRRTQQTILDLYKDCIS